MTAYSPDIKAAVLAAIAGGQSLNSTAKQFGVSRRTVQMWRDQAHLPVVTQQKKRAIGEQVYELLEESIETLKAQVVLMRDPAWVKQQSAGELAILHGVLSDKSTRLLAALRPEGESA